MAKINIMNNSRFHVTIIFGIVLLAHRVCVVLNYDFWDIILIWIISLGQGSSVLYCSICLGRGPHVSLLQAPCVTPFYGCDMRCTSFRSFLYLLLLLLSIKDTQVFAYSWKKYKYLKLKHCRIKLSFFFKNWSLDSNIQVEFRRHNSLI